MKKIKKVIELVKPSCLEFVRSLYKPRYINIHGILLKIDYKNFSPLLVRYFLRGTYEIQERRMINKFLKHNDTVLEIGGGVGFIAMLCSAIVGEKNVHVYEANQEIIKAAKSNFKLNNLYPKITNAAIVGDNFTEDTLTFHIHSDFWSSSIDKKQNTKPIVVPALKFSRILKDKRPTFLIMDVEGAEYDILTHTDLTTYLNKICIEVHTRYTGRKKVNDIVACLFSQGFDLDFTSIDDEPLYFERRGIN